MQQQYLPPASVGCLWRNSGLLASRGACCAANTAVEAPPLRWPAARAAAPHVSTTECRPAKFVVAARAALPQPSPAADRFVESTFYWAHLMRYDAGHRTTADEFHLPDLFTQRMRHIFPADQEEDIVLLFEVDAHTGSDVPHPRTATIKCHRNSTLIKLPPGDGLRSAYDKYLVEAYRVCWNTHSHEKTVTIVLTSPRRRADLAYAKTPVPVVSPAVRATADQAAAEAVGWVSHVGKAKKSIQPNHIVYISYNHFCQALPETPMNKHKLLLLVCSNNVLVSEPVFIKTSLHCPAKSQKAYITVKLPADSCGPVSGCMVHRIGMRRVMMRHPPYSLDLVKVDVVASAAARHTSKTSREAATAAGNTSPRPSCQSPMQRPSGGAGGASANDAAAAAPTESSEHGLLVAATHAAVLPKEKLSTPPTAPGSFLATELYTPGRTPSASAPPSASQPGMVGSAGVFLPLFESLSQAVQQLDRLVNTSTRLTEADKHELVDLLGGVVMKVAVQPDTIEVFRAGYIILATQLQQCRHEDAVETLRKLLLALQRPPLSSE